MNSKEVKDILRSLGADLCGIASIDMFRDAPKGYHPLDVMPTCKSVISFGCRFPMGQKTLILQAKWQKRILTACRIKELALR